VSARTVPAPALSPAAAIRVEAGVSPPVESALRVGMWLGIAAITMLFLAFTSAYIVRHGIDPQWQSIRMPRLLPVNTMVLLLSSICLEKARRGGGRRPWLLATLGGGLLFVGGQLAIWQQLGGTGQVFAGSAHASFFYTLTAVHGLHLAGGLVALGWVSVAGSMCRRWMDAVALYWHFMGALWLYLVVLLFGVR
jgi:cytochrome c oxidase subunit III